MTGLVEKIREGQGNQGVKPTTPRAIEEIPISPKMIELAKRFPRDRDVVRDRVLQSCRIYPFAKKAFFKREAGGKYVNGVWTPTIIVGPSIRFAEEVSLCYGNFDYGTRFTERSTTYTRYFVFGIDKETLNCVTQEGEASHWRHYKDKEKPPRLETRPAQIYEMVMADAAKRLRSVILRLLPNSLIFEAEQECRKTLDRAENFKPKSITEELMELGATKEQMQERYGDLTKPKEGIRALAIQDLQSIKAGDCTVALIFGGKDD